jgi:hypothetical protein
MTDIDDTDEIFNDPVLKFDTIANLECAKRAFFNKDYVTFSEEIKAKPYQLYYVNYKFNTDMNDKLPYICSNLNTGFAKEFSDFTKYIFCCFRCIQPDTNIKNYLYSSLWIINTSDIQKILGSRYDDFEWSICNADMIDQFISNFIQQQKEELYEQSNIDYFVDDDDPYNMLQSPIDYITINSGTVINEPDISSVTALPDMSSVTTDSHINYIISEVYVH